MLSSNDDEFFWSDMHLNCKDPGNCWLLHLLSVCLNTDKLGVMFCETQHPKGMVSKMNNFINDGDKLDLAIK